MYTSEPLQTKVRADAPAASTARSSSSAKNLSSLPPLSRAGYTSTASRRPPKAASLKSSRISARSFPLSPLQTHGALRPLSPEEGAGTRHVVMDPLAALRRCLQYVCSHPEVYGDDVRGLLDREVMHVVRLKASEMSLTNGERPLLVDPLEGSSIRQGARSFSAVPTLPITSTQSIVTGGAVPGSVSAGDLFGYGSVSFLPASSVGFSALLQESQGDWSRADQAGSCSYSSARKTFSGTFTPTSSSPAAEHVLHNERIQWNHTLPPSGVPASAPDIPLSTVNALSKNEAVNSNAFPEGIVIDCSDGNSNTTHQALSSLPQGVAFDLDNRFVPHPESVSVDLREDTPTALSMESFHPMCMPDDRTLLVDQQGYEVTYLRVQLQQLEAAFNSKCVRLHELEVENRQLVEKVKTSEETTAQWAAQHHAMKGQVEVMRRELDGWKDRANDAVTAATKRNKQQNLRAKQIVYSQLSDAKQEVARLGQLWRETERALQETRRSFENTEKEASAAHSHLTDVFHYLERLERRIARRDAYVSLCERRQRSLEEKYEKLRWGYEELSTLEGHYSYADYILTTSPLWSVYMFVRLVRHQGDYVAVENPMEVQQRLLLMTEQGGGGREVSPEAVAATLAAMEPLYGLIFSRSSQGGRLVSQEYDIRLVFRTMVEETTGDVSRRCRPRQVRAVLHGAVACRSIRWHERYSIDYLRGQADEPESEELQRKCVPLLTVASVLLPLRSRTGAILMPSLPKETPDPAAAVTDSAAPEQATRAEEERVETLLSTISNKQNYDEGTIRFVLRCFWKQRLAAFTQQMNIRVCAIKEKRACRQGLERSVQKEYTDEKFLTGKGVPAVDEESDCTDEHDDDEVDVGVIPTFLAALVDFSTRFTAQHAGSGMTALTKSSAPPSKATLLSVRGVLTRGACDTKLGGRSSVNASSADSKATRGSLWDCGRIFFAVVLQPCRSTADEGGTRSSTIDVPTSEEVSILAEEARELLAALYYYALEYKDLDPDFRLFYLVAHQMIPEMVAVNFFASLEAFELDSTALLKERLQCLSARTDGGADHTATGEPLNSPIMPKEVEDPLTALARVVDMIDDALLDGEEEDIETDSDGDGYGSILPFHASAKTHVRSCTTPSTSTGQPHEGKKEESASEETQSPLLPESKRASELRLLHNVRSYLRERRRLMRGQQDAEDFDSDPELSGSAASPVHASRTEFSSGAEPSEWTALEERVLNILGPHTALLDAFRHHHRSLKGNDALQVKRKPRVVGKELDHLRRRRAERKSRHATTKYLSATRGLLAIEDVLMLVQRHCLATYAVSCCGTPRFSLLHALFGRGSDRNSNTESELHPYAIIGHLPLTGLHLQRLRFALSLDQPSHLVRPFSLFAADPVTKSNSQFYDTYLTIVLDVFEQQQSFLMHSVLCCCAARHEVYAVEGAEDCDGLVPIACLKKGLASTFATINGTSQHALAVLDHLLQYDELLRLEDEVKFEQFADAPLLLNIPPRKAGDLFRATGDTDMGPSPDSTEGQEKWNLREEADSCSLLNIAFALRMTYIVWGEVNASTAEALVHHIVKRAVPVCCSDAVLSDGISGMPSATMNKDATVVEEFSEWAIFDQATRQDYARALTRLQKGHNGNTNPLRRTLAALQTELLKPSSMLRSGPETDAGESLSPGVVNPDALYPDVSNMWTTTKVLAEVQERMETTEAALSARSTSTFGKDKKKRHLPKSRKSLSRVHSAASGNGSVNGDESVPDYGLLSLARALGFASSLSASIPRVGGAAANKKGVGKKNAKKKGAPKSRCATETGIPVFLQKEYSEQLSLQLQDLAARVASLTLKDLNRSSVNVSECENVTVNVDVATAPVNNLLASDPLHEDPAAGSASSPGHAVSLSGQVLQSTSQSKPQKRITIVPPIHTERGSMESTQVAPAWEPLFPDSPSMLEAEGAPGVRSTPMDVTKLYAICAALSMT